MQEADGELPGLSLPVRFGKYTLIRKLATGGMAELFLAIQKSVAGFEKLVVIKRILPAASQDGAFVEMLLHEARIAATLSHPNVVQTFDVGEVDGTYFIAMEHVHGEDLRSIVRQMKKKSVLEFPLEHALSIVLGTCAGLAYAHERRDLDGTPLHIVHRDVSPQNVVVTFTGDVKVVDFGIAKSVVRVETFSRSGHLKGKVPYMSPEQARSESVDWRSDVFSTGVLLFELTTGKRLFKGANEYETLKLICDAPYPTPSQAHAGYPAALERIVTKALEKDRAKRWQSAREMQAAIEEFVRSERLAASTIGLSQFMQAIFEEKLAVQKEAVLQGRQLADVIALESSSDSMGSIDARSPVSSTGAAARTVSVRPQEKAKGGWVGIGAAAMVVALAGAGVWWNARAVRMAAGRGPAAAMELPPPSPASPSRSSRGVLSAQAATVLLPPGVEAGVSAPRTAPSASGAPAGRR